MALRFGLNHSYVLKSSSHTRSDTILIEYIWETIMFIMCVHSHMELVMRSCESGKSGLFIEFCLKKNMISVYIYMTTFVDFNKQNLNINL